MGVKATKKVYHKVLKSGCRVEQRQFEDVQRIRRYLAVDLSVPTITFGIGVGTDKTVDNVVAWRVLFLTMLGALCLVLVNASTN